MTSSGNVHSTVDPDLPCWAGYREILQGLELPRIPTAHALTALLPDGIVNRRGLPIRFVPASSLAVSDYEKQIFETGEVSTRENDWHDFFNALVWCRFPSLKAALNARHHQQLKSATCGQRGAVRDALTLLDESGVIVTGTDPVLLQALADKDWFNAFVAHREQWRSTTRVMVCGHAILEKFLNPYKSVTAHALLLHAPAPVHVGTLDAWLGEAVGNGEMLESPACLSPLPLMGIPGWWREGPQDEVFYNDQDVFRPDSGRRPAAPVHSLSID